MNIIFVNNNGNCSKSIKISPFTFYSILSVFILLILFFVFLFTHVSVFRGYLSRISVGNYQPIDYVIQEQQDEIDSIKSKLTTQMDGFVNKLAQLQSKLILLEKSANQYIKLNHLNVNTFDTNKQCKNRSKRNAKKEATQVFHQVKPEISSVEQSVKHIQAVLEAKSQQLFVIQALYDEDSYIKKITPMGKPVKNGKISSYFGKRKDPFTATDSFHKGLDITASLDSNIIATASGLVTWAKKKTGYGNMIEISHGNGLFTRYGHCKKLLVREGQRVQQGEAIATIGISGRSTGPHVHYEVLKNDVKINPLAYVKPGKLSYHLLQQPKAL